MEQLCIEPLAVELYSVNSPDYELDRRYPQGGFVEFPIPQIQVCENCYFYTRHTPGTHATYNGQTEGQLIRLTPQGDLELALYEGYTADANGYVKFTASNAGVISITNNPIQENFNIFK